MEQGYSYTVERKPDLPRVMGLGEWELTELNGRACMGYCHFDSEDAAHEFGKMWVETMTKFSR